MCHMNINEFGDIMLTYCLFLLLDILMVNRRMKDMVRWEEVQEVK